MAEMIKKTCNQCGKNCWHNPCMKKDRDYRCTYCGYPPGANAVTDKRALQDHVMRTQTVKARYMK